jgi:hypothetical protein
MQLSVCYLILAYTGARQAEIVKAKKRNRKTGSYGQLFGPKIIAGISRDDSSNVAPDVEAGLLEKLISQEIINWGRLKALCY